MLCLTCGRVRPAEAPADYTVRRARLIVQHGLCVCFGRVIQAMPVTVAPPVRAPRR